MHSRQFSDLVCRDDMFISPWYRSVHLHLVKEYLHEALQCIPDMLGIQEVWVGKVAFVQIHVQR